jgi:hypothetical protein
MNITNRIKVAFASFLTAVAASVIVAAPAFASPVLLGYIGSVTGPFPYTVRSNPQTVAQYYVNFNRQFQSISTVCIGLSFSGDLLSYGEQLWVVVPGGTTGVVLENYEANPVESKRACFTHPSDTDPFKNGAYAVRVYATVGSATISSASAWLYQ